MHKYTVVGRSSLVGNRGCQAAKFAKPGLITARRPLIDAAGALGDHLLGCADLVVLARCGRWLISRRGSAAVARE